VAQAARLVVVDRRDLRALRPDLQQLVDLLLVFGEGEAHVGVVDREDALGGGGILVQRDRDGAQRLRRQHRGVQPRTVGAHDHHVFAACQAGLVQAAGDVLHHLRQLGPGERLPDAVFLLPHRRGFGPLRRMLQQQPRESCLHAVS
jgi:hypothetical protein